MIVYRDGAQIWEIPISDNATLKRRIGGEDEITCQVIQSSGAAFLSVGDYIVFEGRNYYLSRTPKLEKVSAVEHRFDLTFEADVYTLLNKLYRQPVTGRGDFSLVGTLDDFVDVLLTNINTIDLGWTKGNIPTTDRKLLTFDGESCRAVLNRLADDFDVEFVVTGKQIAFYDIFENPTSLTFQHGRGKGLYQLTRDNVDSESTVTRGYFWGSSKNIDYNYRGGEQRLIFIDPTTGTNRIDNFGDFSKIVEKQVIFEDVWPSFNGTINTVSTDKKTFTCSAINFDLNQYLIEGLTAKVVFLSGDLQAMQFEIESYNQSTKSVKLIEYSDELGGKYPNSSFYPRVNDLFTFVDIRMPQSYIDAAEVKLAQKASDWMNYYSKLRVKYSLTLDPRYLRQNAITLNIGDVVRIIDSDLGIDKQLRIISVQKDIKDPYKVTCEISNILEERWQKQISKKVSEALNAANAASKENTKTTISVNLSAKDYAKLVGGNVFVDEQTFNGRVNINGDIYQNGSAYVTHAEHVYSKDDLIFMRDGAISGLAAGTLSGFKILKANGSVNLILGAGNDAIARVGWEGGSLQAIATRQDLPLSNGIAVWNNTASRFDTPYAITDFPRKSENATIPGKWYFNNDLEIRNGKRTLISAKWGFDGVAAEHSTFIEVGRNETSYGQPRYKIGAISNRTWGDLPYFKLLYNRDGADIWKDVISVKNGDFVGINVAEPTSVLHVGGDIRSDNHIYTGSYGNVYLRQSDTYMWGGGHAGLTAAGVNYFRAQGTSNQFILYQNTQFDASLYKSDFISGFAGSGWKLDASDNHLTVDKLTVRGSMSVYELVINQLRSTNGSLWVSDAMKVSSASARTDVDNYTFNLYFDTDGGSKGCPFIVGDIIQAQKFDGRNVIKVVGRVDFVGSDVIRFSTTNFSNTPASEVARLAGLDFVRIGNISDTNRQGALYLTSSDDGAPYMDILDGVNTGSTSGKIRLRIGNLPGIYGQSGYGIWGSQDGVNEAFVISSAGYARIAGWNFNNYAIWMSYNSNHLGISNAETESADGIGRIRKGFTLYRDDTAVGANGLKIIRIGLLPARDGTVFTGTSTNYGIQIMEKRNSVQKDIFRVDNDGALIAGCNFNAGSIWSTGWTLNADGSGQFGGDKIKWDASGNMIISESLLASSLIGQTLQSLNWNGTEGILFDLNGGVLTFGNSIDIDSVGGFINVKNKSTQITGVKIGDFSLTPTSSGGVSINVDISGSSTKYGSGSSSDYDNQQGSISSTGAIQGSIVTISSSLIVGAVYTISAGLKFTFSQDAFIGTLVRTGYFASRDYFDRDVTLKVQVVDGSNNVLINRSVTFTTEVGGTSFSHILSLYETIIATTTSLKIVWSIDGEVLAHSLVGNYANYTTDDRRYLTRCVVSEAYSSSRLIVIPSTSITEVSAQGFQSLWGTDKYFRIFDDPNASNPFISSAGYFKHSGLLEVYNNNFKIRNGNVLTYNDWLYKATGVNYNLEIGSSLKFQIKNTSSSTIYAYLPTLSTITSAIGSGTARFEVLIQCDKNSVGNIRIAPASGVSLYNRNGNTTSYLEMGGGDTAIAYFDGDSWNLFSNMS